MDHIKYLEAFFENYSNPAWIKNTKGEYVAVNSAFLKKLEKLRNSIGAKVSDSERSPC